MADKKISALTGATTPLAGTEVLPIVQSGATVKVSAANVTAGRDTSFKTGLATPRNGAKPTNNSVVNGLTVFNDQDNVTGDGVSIFLDHSFGTPGTDTRGVKFSSSADTAYSGFVSAKVQVTNDGALVDSLIFRSSRDVAVSAGNLVIGTSGKGIDFSATPGTGTSELLADYEEGSWTPVVTADAGSITTYSASGSYTKVGNIVTLRFAVNVSNVGTAFGAMRIAGLPFTSVSYADTYPAGTFLVRETALTGQSYQGFNNANSTNAFIAALSGATVNWTNGVVYVFSGTYRAA
jgi:hypothetical protein